MTRIDISTHDTWPDAAAVVDEGLDRFNADAAPLHEVRRMACIARIEGGEVVGGALGRRWGRCGELQELWVHPAHRRTGVGTRLVEAFEQLARDQGCESVHLETLSFQAPAWYGKRGYVSEYERHDYPHGVVKHYMIKPLGSAQTAQQAAPDAPMRVHGSCHCQAVRYQAEVDPRRTGLCHCTDCQKLTGSAYRVSVPAIDGTFRLLAGEPRVYIKTGDSGSRRAQAFCGGCGSPLYTYDAEQPQAIGLRVGCIEERAALVPRRQKWCRSALGWTQSLSALERRDGE